MSDVVWPHRWLITKIQKEETKVHIMGIDMSSTFDTVNRKDLIQILGNILR